MSRSHYATRRQALLGTAAIAAGLAMKNASAQDASPEAASAEEEAVGQTLFMMAMSYAKLDPDAGASVYTENAEWLNAFGDSVQGRENIHAKLTELFASDEFAAGETVGQPDGSVTILTDTTAVGWTYQEIKDQQVAGSDEVIPLRKNHSLAVLVKEDGQWLIAAHMFMDENII